MNKLGMKKKINKDNAGAALTYERPQKVIEFALTESERQSLGMPPTPTVPDTYQVVIVGGGPIGLTFALLLLEYGRRRKVRYQVHIYEPRWTKEENEKIRWKREEEGNNRRWQVVTIQSNVWSKLPSHVKAAIFSKQPTEKSGKQPGQDFSEMWPLGPDSPKDIGYPRNIPVRILEDKLLHLIQMDHKRSCSAVETQQPPAILKCGRLTQEAINEIMKEKKGIDFIILSDGAASRTEKKLFPNSFGSRTPFPEDSELKIKENVLGIFFDVEGAGLSEDSVKLSEADSMALTVCQNRFLLNPLGKRRGFLNMWLSDEESEGIVGVNNLMEVTRCTQGRPCMFFRDPAKKKFCCPTHSSYFAPSLPFVNSPIWPRILDGLKLYGIPESAVRGFTSFQLGPYQQRTNFVANIISCPSSNKKSTAFAFLLGDSAISVSFRAGRGMNTGMKSAISLARSITKAAEAGRWRSSDFISHTSVMNGLQEREVRIRSLGMMQEIDALGKSTTILSKITNGIEIGRNGSEQEHNKLRNEFQKRVARAVNSVFTKDRLPQGITIPNPERLKKAINNVTSETISVLAVSGAWLTQSVGGAEVEPDDLLPEPKWKTTHNNWVRRKKIANQGITPSVIDAVMATTPTTTLRHQKDIKFKYSDPHIQKREDSSSLKKTRIKAEPIAQKFKKEPEAQKFTQLPSFKIIESKLIETYGNHQ